MANGVACNKEKSALKRKIPSRNKPSKSTNRADGNRRVRIILADDRRLCRESIKQLIETIDPALDVVEAVDVDRIGPLLEQGTGTSVVLYNLVLVDREGLDFVGTLSKSMGDFPLVVMCDADDNAFMRSVLERGAKAFLPSSTPGPLMVAILHLVIAGGGYAPPAMVMGLSAKANKAARRAGPGATREQVIADNFPTLTPRQRHVLALLSQGLTNRDIASSLDMRENTVKAHVKQVMRKLSADNRTQAALMADRLIR